MCCVNCGKNHSESFIKTAYGNWLCEDCWDDYICTEAGLLEYLIGICSGELSINDYDADFLCGVAKSWMLNYKVLDFTSEQLVEFEKKAKELGLL